MEASAKAMKQPTPHTGALEGKSALAALSSTNEALVRARSRTELFDLVSGFVYSQWLAACVELQLFERLARRQIVGIERLERDLGGR